jgi:hypothetical protein
MLRSRYTRAFAIACTAVAIAVPSWMAANSSGAEAPTVPQLTAPPLFAVAGQSRVVTAIVDGDPLVVRLIAQHPQQTTSVPVIMRKSEDGLWQASIPSHAVRPPAVVYSVTATYAGSSLSSESARLVVLDDIRTAASGASSIAGRTIASLPLDAELGVRGGDESAKELPASFAVEPSTGNLLVLDSVNARVLRLDGSGAVVGTTPLAGGTTTASDIVFDRSNGAAYVLDQTNDSVIALAPGGQTTVNALGTRAEALGSRLAQFSRTTYLKKAGQGRYIPLLDRGRRVSAADRPARTRDGLPTKIGALAAEVEGNDVVFGLVGTEPHGFRVSFDGTVLDAGELLADDDGIVWLLVGVASGDGAAMHLVRLDPADGSASSTEVGASLPGDVTRRLASAGTGVIVLESDGSSLRYVRYGDGSDV